MCENFQVYKSIKYCECDIVEFVHFLIHFHEKISCFGIKIEGSGPGSASKMNNSRSGSWNGSERIQIRKYANCIAQSRTLESATQGNVDYHENEPSRILSVSVLRALALSALALTVSRAQLPCTKHFFLLSFLTSYMEDHSLTKTNSKKLLNALVYLQKGERSLTILSFYPFQIRPPASTYTSMHWIRIH